MGYQEQNQELKIGYPEQNQELKIGYPDKNQELKMGYLEENQELKTGYPKLGIKFCKELVLIYLYTLYCSPLYQVLVVK